MHTSRLLPLALVALLGACRKELPQPAVQGHIVHLDLSGTVSLPEPPQGTLKTLRLHPGTDTDGKPVWGGRLRLVHDQTRPIPGILCINNSSGASLQKRVLFTADRDNKLSYKGSFGLPFPGPYKFSAYIGFDAKTEGDYDLHIHETDPSAQHIQFFGDTDLGEVSPQGARPSVRVILKCENQALVQSTWDADHYVHEKLYFTLSGSILLCRVLYDDPSVGSSAGGKGVPESAPEEVMTLRGFELRDFRTLHPQLKFNWRDSRFELLFDPATKPVYYPLREPAVIHYRGYAPAVDPSDPDPTGKRSAPRYLIYIPQGSKGLLKAKLEHGSGQKNIEAGDGEYHLVTIRAFYN